MGWFEIVELPNTCIEVVRKGEEIKKLSLISRQLWSHAYSSKPGCVDIPVLNTSYSTTELSLSSTFESDVIHTL